MVFCQFCNATQDHKVTLAEAGNHPLFWLAQLAVVVLGEGAHVLTGLLTFIVVLIATTATIDKRLALLEEMIVCPPWLI